MTRRGRTFAAVLLASPFLALQLLAQNPSDPRAVGLIQRSLAALTNGKSVTDITVMGTARRIAGSDDESGGVIAKALVTGEVRIDFNFPSGQRSEIRTNMQRGPGGNWSGPDGALHSVAAHNMLADDSAWFAPLLALQHHMNSSNNVISYVGQESVQGHAVEHLIVSRQFPPSQLPVQVMALVNKSAAVNIYLDATTHLPAELSYLTHPDNDIQVDVPIDVRFSDYRTVNGSQVPFHVQKFLRGALILDLAVQTVATNSGLSAGSLNLPQ